MRCIAISFDYGQRHRKELEFAERMAADLDAPWTLIDLHAAGIAGVLTGSALTDETVTVPDGHYADESMKITVVPNRNAIMLSIACALAVTRDAGAVAFGAHTGDHFIYPDCRPEFVRAFELMVNVAVDGIARIEILAPFLSMTKTDIVKLGDELQCHSSEPGPATRVAPCIAGRAAPVWSGAKRSRTRMWRTRRRTKAGQRRLGSASLTTGCSNRDRRSIRGCRRLAAAIEVALIRRLRNRVNARLRPLAHGPTHQRGHAGTRRRLQRGRGRPAPQRVRASLRLRLVVSDPCGQLFDNLLTPLTSCLSTPGEPAVGGSSQWERGIMGDRGQASGSARDRATPAPAKHDDGGRADSGHAGSAAGDDHHTHDAAAHHDGASAQGRDRRAEPAPGLLYFSSGVSCCFAHSTSSFKVCTV